eukprot:gb/GECG01006969.1/.p1 GENE.gb/GECG01006969.1/~~gb/GECG01006969.1/.p1  ORF type:complete len:298 (+),score=24.09 gb/GECG01006969.1/:1-894(+)
MLNVFSYLAMMMGLFLLLLPAVDATLHDCGQYSGGSKPCKCTVGPNGQLTVVRCCGSSNPTVINFFGGNMQKIEENAFASCSSVVKITFHRNLLEELPDMSNLPSLAVVDFGDNYIKDIPSSAFRYTNLSWVDLSGNAIKELKQGPFLQKPHLDSLFLQDNQIQSVDSRIFSPGTPLTTFCLSLNPIQSLPSNLFTNTPKLQKLQLGNDSLGSSLSINTFNTLTDLVLLDLRKNNLQCLPNGIFAGISGNALMLTDNPGSSKPCKQSGCSYQPVISGSDTKFCMRDSDEILSPSLRG